MSIEDAIEYIRSELVRACKDPLRVKAYGELAKELERYQTDSCYVVRETLRSERRVPPVYGKIITDDGFVDIGEIKRRAKIRRVIEEAMLRANAMKDGESFIVWRMRASDFEQ